MRTSLLIFISLFILITGCFAQNWAPFYFNNKTLYSTPDPIGGLLVGESLALVRFDTSVASSEGVTTFCKKGLGPDEQMASFRNSKSLVCLYGRKVVAKENRYWFFPHILEEDSILYKAHAEPGQIAISALNFSGLVQTKEVEWVNGQPDSIKVIFITETRNPGETYHYTATVSKTRGFLKVPSFFTKSSERRPEYSFFGDYDQDIKGVKTFASQVNLFQPGDVFISTSYDSYSINFNFIWSYIDTIKSEVVSVFGDSCLVLDSIKRFNYLNNAITSQTQSRKIENKPFHHFVDTSGLMISDQSPIGYSVKAAFMTTDSCMFVGFMQCGLGLIDADFSRLLSTQFPISFKNEFQFFSSNRQFIPYYFKRGNTTFGQPVEIHFTAVSDPQILKIAVFPNPATNRLNIIGLPPGPATVSLFNLQGKEMMIQSISTETEMDITSLPKGLYQLLMKNGSRIYVDKVLKE